VTGKFHEADAEFKLAQQLDPLSLIIGTQAALPLYMIGRNDEALMQLKKVLEMDPNFVPALSLLGRVYVEIGKYADAVAVLEKAEKISGSETYTAMISWAYASWGKRRDAEKYLKLAREKANGKFLSPFEYAMIYAALGDKDRAFEELERAFELRSNFIVFLKYDPRAVSLRADPRFADLARRIGI
jgi:tetratricopeptide (TPR) repeat protein